MNVKLVFLLSIVFSVSNYSQNIAFENPPGTIKLADSLYIDVAPVDNLMFLEYSQNHDWISINKLDSILNNAASFGLNIEAMFGKKDDSDKLEIFVFNESEQYLRHPKYAYYPAINITEDQAKSYCEWRTKAALVNYAIISKSEKEREKYPKEIKYRLPTVEELNLALETFGYSKGYKVKEKDIPFRVYRKKYESHYDKAIFIKNNLSELTLNSEPFGNNWKNEKPTTFGNDYTGFRCFCEIIN